MLAGVLAIMHFLIGGGIGYFFRVKVLAVAALASSMTIIVACLSADLSPWLILFAAELSLQLGYVAGSSLAMFLRESPEA